MLRRIAVSLTLALLALLALPSLRSHGATPSAATTVYLPLTACPECYFQSLYPTLPPVPTPDRRNFVSEGVRLINEARAAVGCPPAVPHPALMQAAQDWADYIEQTTDYRHTLNGYYTNAPYFYIGAPLVENLGGGSTPEYIVEGWLESPPHKGNIETCYRPDNPSYHPNSIHDIGLGISDRYAIMVIGWRQ